MIELDSWQKEVLACKGSFILCTGRQVGKTTIMAIKAVERMIAQPECKIIIASLTEDQAKLIIVMMQDYLEKNYKTYLKVKKKDKATQNKIVINNHSSALARPVGNTGDALRGFTGDVLILDENSRMNDFIMTSAKPTLLTTGGELWICSTPAGKQGFFWECYQNLNNRFKVFHISSEEVVYNRRITESWSEQRRAEVMKFLENEKKDMSELQYGQEYLGLFLEDLQRFFPDELLKKACILKRPEQIPRENNYLGVDIARLGEDASTFQIISNKGGKCLHIESEVTKKKLTTETEIKIIQMANKFQVKKVGIDAGAGTLGVSVLDHLRESPIKHKVIPLNNRSIALDEDGKQKQKLLGEDMYNNLKSMLEHEELFLLDDSEVYLSLSSLQYEYVKSPMMQSKMRIFSSNHSDSDIAEGLKRAAWLAKKEKSLNLFATHSGDRKYGI